MVMDYFLPFDTATRWIYIDSSRSSPILYDTTTVVKYDYDSYNEIYEVYLHSLVSDTFVINADAFNQSINLLINGRSDLSNLSCQYTDSGFFTIPPMSSMIDTMTVEGRLYKDVLFLHGTDRKLEQIWLAPHVGIIKKVVLDRAYHLIEKQ